MTRIEGRIVNDANNIHSKQSLQMFTMKMVVKLTLNLNLVCGTVTGGEWNIKVSQCCFTIKGQ